MLITLDEWQKINDIIRAAEAAVDIADSLIIEIALRHSRAGNHAEGVRLAELGNRLRESGPIGLGYMTTPQSQWDGRDNMTIREPNWVIGPKTFPPDEVQEYLGKTSTREKIMDAARG